MTKTWIYIYLASAGVFFMFVAMLNQELLFAQLFIRIILVYNTASLAIRYHEINEAEKRKFIDEHFN